MMTLVVTLSGQGTHGDAVSDGGCSSGSNYRDGITAAVVLEIDEIRWDARNPGRRVVVSHIPACSPLGGPKGPARIVVL